MVNDEEILPCPASPAGRVPVVRLMSSAVTALCMWMPAARPLSPAPHLTVHLRITYDASVSSRSFKTIVENETAAIWRPYDVDITSADPDDGALSLSVAIDRRSLRMQEGPVVLGTATLTRNEGLAGPIRVSMDAVDAVLNGRYGSQPLYDYIVAIAVGRVLAHELGHVLLGRPSYHDPIGLMRPSFPPEDLGRYERSRFHLSDRSVERLRARAPVLCGRPSS